MILWYMFNCGIETILVTENTRERQAMMATAGANNQVSKRSQNKTHAILCYIIGRRKYMEERSITVGDLLVNSVFSDACYVCISYKKSSKGPPKFSSSQVNSQKVFMVIKHVFHYHSI